MDIVLVCHTEFGFVSGKTIIGDKKATGGISKGALNLVNLAEKYGAKITFCLCPETVNFFPKNLGHEIGLHIHPGWQELEYDNRKWFVGDKYLKSHCRQSVPSTALRDFSYNEQLEMIKKGKDCLENEFKAPIKVFAAGRWSVNNDTVKALVQTGFTHDLSAPSHSVSDHYDWSKLPRICLPYCPDENDYQLSGLLPILIVPVSQTLFGGTASLEGVTVYGLPWLRACFLEYWGAGLPLFHMSIHSPAMTSPYYISVMEEFLSFVAARKNISFKFASEIKKYPIGQIENNLSFSI
jgi:hypothetical protein